MYKVVGWGTGWAARKREIREPLSEAEARLRFDGNQRVVFEIRTDEGGRGCVIQVPDAGYVEVRLLDWPAGTSGSASLHYSDAGNGEYALLQVRAARSGEDHTDWSQAVHFHAGVRRAILDVPSNMTRYEKSLHDSAFHNEVVGMRFSEPAFGEYDHFLRPDLIERCLVAPEAFDVDWALDEVEAPPSPGV